MEGSCSDKKTVVCRACVLVCSSASVGMEREPTVLAVLSQQLPYLNLKPQSFLWPCDAHVQLRKCQAEELGNVSAWAFKKEEQQLTEKKGLSIFFKLNKGSASGHSTRKKLTAEVRPESCL